MDDKPTVLFVDDEERIIRLLNIMFRSEYEVYTALGARQALEIMEAVPIDVIVSDQRMPDVAGIELLSQVRQRWPETMRLLLTGYSDLVAIIGAVNEGEVHRFLTKPWSQAELRAVIAEAAGIVLNNRSTHQKVRPIWRGDVNDKQFGVTSQLLAIEGCDADRQEIVEMFSRNFRVHPARSSREAVEIMSREKIGVIIASTDTVETEMTNFLSDVFNVDPTITTVAMTASPHSDTIIQLINNGRIYRLAIKPLSPSLFRLAVNAAMREHNRRLADPCVLRPRKQHDAARSIDHGPSIISFVARLSQTKSVL